MHTSEAIFEALGWMFFRLLCVLVGAAVMGVRALQRFRVYQQVVPSTQVHRALGSMLVLSLVDAAVFVLVHRLQVIRFGPSTVIATLGSFVAIFVWFELSYFTLHRALHTRALYAIHRLHHEATVAHPFSAFAFSVGERVLQVVLGLGVVALGSQFVPVAQVGLEAYLVISYVLNVVAHSNVELTSPSFTKTWWGRLFITTTFHAMHHSRFAGHYGLYTPVLDRLFGSVFSDYEAQHAVAARGTTSLAHQSAPTSSLQAVEA